MLRKRSHVRARSNRFRPLWVSGDRHSLAAADKLGFRKRGVAALVISVLQSPTKAEASYVRRRVYPSVPGYLGKFETFDVALEAAQEPRRP